jgi:hypothetical protein
LARCAGRTAAEAVALRPATPPLRTFASPFPVAPGLFFMGILVEACL